MPINIPHHPPHPLYHQPKVHHNGKSAVRPPTITIKIHNTTIIIMWVVVVVRQSNENVTQTVPAWV
jgi:hypothetical protein